MQSQDTGVWFRKTNVRKVLLAIPATKGMHSFLTRIFSYVECWRRYVGRALAGFDSQPCKSSVVVHTHHLCIWEVEEGRIVNSASSLATL